MLKICASSWSLAKVILRCMINETSKLKTCLIFVSGTVSVQHISLGCTPGEFYFLFFKGQKFVNTQS